MEGGQGRDYLHSRSLSFYLLFKKKQTIFVQHFLCRKISFSVTVLLNYLSHFKYIRKAFFGFWILHLKIILYLFLAMFF